MVNMYVRPITPITSHTVPWPNASEKAQLLHISSRGEHNPSKCLFWTPYIGRVGGLCLLRSGCVDAFGVGGGLCVSSGVKPGERDVKVGDLLNYNQNYSILTKRLFRKETMGMEWWHACKGAFSTIKPLVLPLACPCRSRSRSCIPTYQQNAEQQIISRNTFHISQIMWVSVESSYLLKPPRLSPPQSPPFLYRPASPPSPRDPLARFSLTNHSKPRPLSFVSP